SRLGARRALVILYLALAGLAGALAAVNSRWGAVVCLLAYVFTAAINWPILESVVTAGADAHDMSRRVGTYNIVWASAGALAVASAGWVIARWPAALF